jgi:hypothetical protein
MQVQRMKKPKKVKRRILGVGVVSGELTDDGWTLIDGYTKTDDNGIGSYVLACKGDLIGKKVRFVAELL